MTLQVFARKYRNSGTALQLPRVSIAGALKPVSRRRLMPGTKHSPKQIKVDDLAKEVGEIEEYIRQVSIELTNPELALAASVRLSVRQRELQAYVRGILFAMGRVPSWQDELEPELEY